MSTLSHEVRVRASGQDLRSPHDCALAGEAAPPADGASLLHIEKPGLACAAKWEEESNATSTSLDAGDEADFEPRGDVATKPASSSSAAPDSLTVHPRMAEPEDSDGLLTRLPTDGHRVVEKIEDEHTDALHEMLPHTAHPPHSEVSASPPISLVLRRRTAKRSTLSTPLSSRDDESSNKSATLSPVTSVPAPMALPSLSSAFAETSASPSGEGATSTKTMTPEEPLASSAALTAVRRRLSSAIESDRQFSSSPPASPQSRGSATTATDFSDGSPAQHPFDSLRSPLTTPLRLAPHSAAELQQFGCCVFFFPTPLISWLFPLIGHVAISNAEGSRLYTFESSYYVREEKMVTVLDRVLREEMLQSAHGYSPRHACYSVAHSPHPSEAADSLRSPRLVQSPLPPRIGGAGGAASDASASDTGAPSLASAATAAASPMYHNATTPVFSSRSSARAPPSRRSRRSRSSGAVAATGHAHTHCVRIWDLKPLLMESRGRRTKRAPYSIMREGGKQAAVALWERLQELLQPGEGGGTVPTNGVPSDVPLFSPSSRTCGRSTMENNDDGDGVRSAPGVSSSSGDEEDEYELLDSETARFYNRNLNATIRLFRGSADGSNNSPDVVLQHHSSFSFVGFVLEACGIGSQAKLSAAAASNGTTAANAENSAAADTLDASNTAKTETSGSDEEIHWGAMKLLFHVFLFGKWRRGDRQLWRALHGGSITSAAILWTVLIAVCFHYFRLMFWL